MCEQLLLGYWGEGFLLTKRTGRGKGGELQEQRGVTVRCVQDHRKPAWRQAPGAARGGDIKI